MTVVFSIVLARSEAQKNLGYCPQFDALWDELTAREHLKVYSLINGAHPADTDKVDSLDCSLALCFMRDLLLRLLTLC